MSQYSQFGDFSSPDTAINAALMTLDIAPSELQDITFYGDVKNISNKLNTFMKQNHLIKASNSNFLDAKQFSNESMYSMENINTAMNPSTISDGSIMQLVEQCGIAPGLRQEAGRAVKIMLNRLCAAGSGESLRIAHFDRVNHMSAGDNVTRGTACYAPTLSSIVSNIGMPSAESFGQQSDKVSPDVNTAMLVTLLQFHKGILDRLLHRRSCAQPNITFKVPYANVYDQAKANAATAEERVYGDHVIPIIDLYNDGSAVSNQLVRIIPLLDNAKNGEVHSNGYINFGAEANLFDLSKLAGQYGHSHYNHTDLVSEGAFVESILVEVSKGSVKEVFEVNVGKENSARLVMTNNVADSGLRATQIEHTFRFNKESRTIEGSASTIFADCTETDNISVSLHAGVTLSIKWSYVIASSSARFKPHNIHGAPVSATVETLAGSIQIKPIAYSVDAKYSEENLRKSTISIMHHMRLFDFEIANGRNILYDYSVKQFLPEYLLNLVTEVTSIGQDYRGLEIISKELEHVHDVFRDEAKDPKLKRLTQRLGFAYIAGQLVNPTVIRNTIDLSNVNTIKSSDYMSDVRAYVEWELLGMTSALYQKSYYRQQLGTEQPVFRCLTSNTVLDNLLSVEHIHNHLNHNTPSDGVEVEYTRVLANGTVLEIITHTFATIGNTLYMIPYRKNAPTDILNWGQNLDFGTFVAHYTPQNEQAANKRLYSNSRAIPIPTNPMGMVSEFVNMPAVVAEYQNLGIAPVTFTAPDTAVSSAAEVKISE